MLLRLEASFVAFCWMLAACATMICVDMYQLMKSALYDFHEIWTQPEPEWENLSRGSNREEGHYD